MRSFHCNYINIYWAILEKTLMHMGHWPVKYAESWMCTMQVEASSVCLSSYISQTHNKLSDSRPAALQHFKDHRKFQIHDLSMFYFMCMFVCSFLIGSQAFSINGTSWYSNNALFFCTSLFKYFKTQFKGKLAHNLH